MKSIEIPIELRTYRVAEVLFESEKKAPEILWPYLHRARGRKLDFGELEALFNLPKEKCEVFVEGLIKAGLLQVDLSEMTHGEWLESSSEMIPAGTAEVSRDEIAEQNLTIVEQEEVEIVVCEI